MGKWFLKQLLRTFIIVLSLYPSSSLWAQTDLDAIMINQKIYYGGAVLSSSQWTNYWEGSLLRHNTNFGKVTTNSLNFLSVYGLSGKLNIIAALPYIKTKGSSGSMQGVQGLQDVSFWLKWKAIQTNLEHGKLALFGLAGYSFPVTDYTADYLPFSIGSQSKSLSIRGMADYQYKKLFATTSGTFTRRSNITIHRDAYYSDRLNQTNEVFIPDALHFSGRVGYRSSCIIIEAIATHWRTLGGFDIRKNDMPFPGNRMIGSTVGFNCKYQPKPNTGLAFTFGGNYMVAGRNIGQASTINGGIFYNVDFNSKHH